MQRRLFSLAIKSTRTCNDNDNDDDNDDDGGDDDPVNERYK